MKKIKLIFTSMLLVFIAVSCENDGGSSVLELTEAAVPNIRKIASTDQGLNVLALQNGEDIDIGLTVDKAFGEITAIDVVGFYTKNGVTEKAVLKANITSFPTTLHFNQNDLYAAFTALNSAADINLADKLIITADLKLKDGSTVKMFDDKGVALYGADIANITDFAVVQTYVPSCPLEDTSLFNGDFKVVADGWEDYAPDTIITLENNPADGTFTFRIPIPASSPTYYIVKVNPATNSVTVTTNKLINYGSATNYLAKGTGTVASCTGDINLSIGYFTPDSSGTYGTYDLKLQKVN